MTPQARKHLEKADEFLSHGDANYEQAADEIAAARNAGASWAECALKLGRSDSWCKQLVGWRETPAKTRSSSPYSGYAARVNLRKTKQKLREASPDELAAIIASLPEDALDRLVNALIPKRPARKRRAVWTGPRRRLRLFAVVRNALEDVKFVRSETEEMELTDVDEATLAELLNQIEAEIVQVRASLGRKKGAAGLRAVR